MEVRCFLHPPLPTQHDTCCCFRLDDCPIPTPLARWRDEGETFVLIQTWVVDLEEAVCGFKLAVQGGDGRPHMHRSSESGANLQVSLPAEHCASCAVLLCAVRRCLVDRIDQELDPADNQALLAEAGLKGDGERSENTKISADEWSEKRWFRRRRPFRAKSPVVVAQRAPSFPG